MDWKKKESESLIDYQVRLYRNKDSLGLSNAEIGTLLNQASGKCFDESKWRKFTTAFIKGYDKAVEDGISATDEILELRHAKDELYKERVRNQDALRQHRTMLRDVAREEYLKDIIEDAIKKQSPFIIGENKYISNKDRIGVLPLSDWHYGDYINDFLNEYNDKVFKKRIERLVEETIKYIQMYEIKKLLVINLGDLISGSIHVSSRVLEECDAIEQTMVVANTISSILISLKPYVEEIDFYSVTDNHSRINKNKKEHIEIENYNRIVQWYLESNFANVDNINIKKNYIHEQEDLEIGQANIFDSTILFVHGHNDKLNSTVKDLVLLTKTFPVAVIVGHLHRNFRDEDGEIDLIMSPSLIGANTFSKSIRQTSKPAQKLIVFENRNNKACLIGENPIDLSW